MRNLKILGIFIVFMFLGGISNLNGNGVLYFYVMIFALAAGLVYYAFWFKNFAQKVNSILPLMDSNPDEYISETQKLLENKLTNNIRSMLIINIAVAHMEKGDYSSAKQTLTRINGTSLKKSNRSVYFLNLTYVLIQLGENERALELIKKFKKHFLSLPMGGNLPRLNAFVLIFEAMEGNNWDEAAKQMDDVNLNWPNKVTGVDFTILNNRLEKHNSTLQKS